jgi:hypothetical protein
LIVSENDVVCCSDPEVPVTVTVANVGDFVVFVLEPPQPESAANPIKLATSNEATSRPRLFLSPNRKSVAASAAPVSNGRELRRRAAVVEVVATVSVVEAAPVVGVTVVGANVQVAPVGSPEQANDTAELNPFVGVIVTSVITVWPALTVNTTGEADTTKSGTGRLMT